MNWSKPKAPTVHVLSTEDHELITGALRIAAHHRSGTSIAARMRALADQIERCTLAMEHGGTCESSTGCQPMERDE